MSVDLSLCILYSMVNRSLLVCRVEQPTSTLLQTILLKTVLKVATTYRTVLMSNAFPSSLKSPLLQKSLVTEPTTRLVVQHILQTLIDRHSNASKLSQIWSAHTSPLLSLTQLFVRTCLL